MRLSEKWQKLRERVKITLLAVCLGTALIVIGLYTAIELLFLGVLIFFGAGLVLFDIIFRGEKGEKALALLTLVVTATVILTLVVSTWVVYIPTPPTTVIPTLTICVDNGNYTVNITNVTELTPLSDWLCVVRNSTGQEMFKDSINNLTNTELNNTISVVFLDNDLDGNLSVGDQFKIKSIKYGGVAEQNGHFYLLFKPSRSIGAIIYFSISTR